MKILKIVYVIFLLLNSYFINNIIKIKDSYNGFSNINNSYEKRTTFNNKAPKNEDWRNKYLGPIIKYPTIGKGKIMQSITYDGNDIKNYKYIDPDKVKGGGLNEEYIWAIKNEGEKIASWNSIKNTLENGDRIVLYRTEKDRTWAYVNNYAPDPYFCHLNDRKGYKEIARNETIVLFNVFLKGKKEPIKRYVPMPFPHDNLICGEAKVEFAIKIPLFDNEEYDWTRKPQILGLLSIENKWENDPLKYFEQPHAAKFVKKDKESKNSHIEIKVKTSSNISWNVHQAGWAPGRLGHGWVPFPFNVIIRTSLNLKRPDEHNVLLPFFIIKHIIPEPSFNNKDISTDLKDKFEIEKDVLKQNNHFGFILRDKDVTKFNFSWKNKKLVENNVLTLNITYKKTDYTYKFNIISNYHKNLRIKQEEAIKKQQKEAKIRAEKEAKISAEKEAAKGLGKEIITTKNIDKKVGQKQIKGQKERFRQNIDLRHLESPIAKKFNENISKKPNFKEKIVILYEKYTQIFYIVSLAFLVLIIGFLTFLFNFWRKK